jgi:hypothetical protein
MNTKEILEELNALETLVEECRRRCYSIRTNLGPFPAPAPSGEDQETQKKIVEILNKRRKNFYKTNNNKHE